MKRIGFLVCCLIGLVGLSGCGRREAVAVAAAEAVSFQPVSNSVQPAEAPVVESVIAKVNGEPIYQIDFEKRVEQFQEAEVNSGLVEAQSPERLAQIRQQVLDGLIDQVVIDQAAKTLGITIPAETLDQKVVEMQAEQSQEQFEAWLALNQFSHEDFRRALQAQLVAAELFANVIAQTPTTMAQVHARHILFKDPAAAQAALARLEAGENFVDLAQELSADSATRETGGDLGWFPRGIHYIPPEVEAVAFSLEPGQVSPVIESVIGYHLIRVELKEANRPLTPQQLQTLQTKNFYDLLAQQRAAAQIERFLN
jgi:parvulin-like peptidyl-prolyl isomerase